ncbi:threonine/serine dehydratase [Mesorhizobium sp. BAC0120]|uniref:threonine ammonia-lyase n=1 Tax=Mesorhizobium sp. BAC0120 TaxID=3090670 RepID=UPI00298CD069|nr:threonine/serine dehydratase [Mesorhizobium sp. BAC0120]MDW6023845.1 threonine/serine dehydratase [Mesorhizobium sp. BAC0120]
MAGGNVPDIAAIQDAARRLVPVLCSLPLMESERLNSRVGGRLLVKVETLQPTGSFKIRGAWNRIAQLSPDELARGVLALSSGNHGRAVAWAARATGARRTVVLMPQDAPANKLEQTRALGAQVVAYDRRTADRGDLISRWCREEGLVYIPAFDDPHVVAGAATVAYEVAKEAAASNISLHGFAAACSGGGLIAGSALALGALSPVTEVWGVEPQGYDDTAQSLARGDRVAVQASGETICDALLSLTPGEFTFEINRRRLAGIISASDDDARRGMRAAFEEFGLVTEPSGALALGALLADRKRTEGRTFAVVLSGRNVDSDLFVRQFADLDTSTTPASFNQVEAR